MPIQVPDIAQAENSTVTSIKNDWSQTFTLAS